ncbi:MAG: hypothetical protein IKU27_08625 [Clostridia bacterium]|nr:hypothetical protein [Clostridia bacterium]
MIIILCICLCPPLLALLIGILGMFIPLGYVCYFFAWFAGLTTIFLTLGSLYAFDIEDINDWKTLALSFLIPGTITALLVLAGKVLDEHHIFEVLQWIKQQF